VSPPWKTALVTGASSGLGRGLAAWLAKRDVKVYAAARRLEQLEALKAEAGANIVPLKLDVSNGAATFEAVEKLDADCGGLDLVIANAGVGEDTRPKKVKWDSLQRMIDVNVTGATATLTGALGGMVERKRGHLVWLLRHQGLPGHVPRVARHRRGEVRHRRDVDSPRLREERDDREEPAGVDAVSPRDR
jgi:NADP-dependent 3-hydroxy acid dehydrogenase YdfG